MTERSELHKQVRRAIATVSIACALGFGTIAYLYLGPEPTEDAIRLSSFLLLISSALCLFGGLTGILPVMHNLVMRELDRERSKRRG